jgi:hypothetical protein
MSKEEAKISNVYGVLEVQQPSVEDANTVDNDFGDLDLAREARSRKNLNPSPNQNQNQLQFHQPKLTWLFLAWNTNLHPMEQIFRF